MLGPCQVLQDMHGPKSLVNLQDAPSFTQLVLWQRVSYLTSNMHFSDHYYMLRP